MGDDAFAWMIGPTDSKEFYQTYWEKKPMLVKRADPTYYKDVFSTKGTGNRDAPDTE
jgi:ribosomal protein L16 Arg81 hydroxylase